MPHSRSDSATSLSAVSPSGPAGSVKVVELTLQGRPFLAINAGPLDPFNHAVSFVITCADQAEIDRLWTALSNGGAIEQCGWLKERHGASLQILPAVLPTMINAPPHSPPQHTAHTMLSTPSPA